MRKSHLRPQPRNGHVELLQLFGNLSGLDGLVVLRISTGPLDSWHKRAQIS